MNKDTIVNDTVTALLRSVRADEKFRDDFAKAVASVYEAGVTSAAPKYTSVALTDAEIALIRATLSK
jgi:hypothetical protein